MSHLDLLSNLDIVVSLHQKRWEQLGGRVSGIFSNKLMLKFLRTITEEFHKNGWVIIFCLFINGKSIAAGYRFKFNQKIWCYLVGMDPDYKKYTPGLLFTWESLRLCFSQGFREYDFLRGEETYKSFWTDKYRKEYDILIIRPGIKGSLFLFCTSTSKYVKTIFKKILPSKAYLFLRGLKYNK